MRAAVCAVLLALALGTTAPPARAGEEGLVAELDRARTLTGHDVDVTGRSTPRAGVRLQELRGERWVTHRQGRSDRYGRFSLEVAALAVGTFTYRVVSDGATSDQLTLRVDGRGRPATWATRYDRVYRWNPCETITYRVNARQAPPSWRRDVAGAVRRIELQSGLRLRLLGPTRVMPQPRTDNPAGVDLVVAYARPRDTGYLRGRFGGSVGVAATARRVLATEEGRERALSDGRIVLDASWQRSMPAGFGPGVRRPGLRLDARGRLLMHELGHVVGLGHVDQVGRSEHDQVMYPFATGRLGAWGAGDATGLSRVGADAGCFAPPLASPRASGVVVGRGGAVAEWAG